jgi:hypothetical protein
VNQRKQEAPNGPITGADVIATLIVLAVVAVVLFFLTRRAKANGGIELTPSQPVERWKHWEPFDD